MQDDKEKILKDYEKKADAIIAQMLQVLTRAHRKVEDKKYRKVLEEVQKT